MAGRSSHISQTAAILKTHEAARNIEVIRAHIRRILESPSLKGSKRSQEFLQFIVFRALEGHFEELKERTVGVELFGRAPSYDTGADAIVRVTACDVRRRLQQYYAEHPDDTEVRIELPPGSYIPEFRSNPAPPVHREPAPPPRRPKPWMLLALAAGLIGAAWFGLARTEPQAGVLPWSAVLPPGGKTQIIFCDPEIVTIQRLMNYSVTLSDYANHRFWPAQTKPEMEELVKLVSFRGVSVAAVDAATATKISGLAIRHPSNRIETRPARTVRLTDFAADDSFILFGSPRSNPWVGLFEEYMGFRFEFDTEKKAEFIRDTRARKGEPSTYVPTAVGWGTGHAYAIVALVNNPNHEGRVLILAGSNAEATEAAGRFSTNLPQISQVLRDAGIDPGVPRSSFEVLLRVSAMAGSPSTFEVVSCRRLGT